MNETSRERRRYDSPARRLKAAETRERIVDAGADLVHGFAGWDWQELTFRAVAERAGVGERTVYRHFPTERHLRDAVMTRLEQDAGITYEDVDLANLATSLRGSSLRCDASRSKRASGSRPIRPSSAPISAAATRCCAP